MTHSALPKLFNNPQAAPPVTKTVISLLAGESHTRTSGEFIAAAKR